MNRRSFLRTSLAAVPAATLGGGVAAAASATNNAEQMDVGSRAEPFQLAYAPHFGMFKNQAGDELVAQLEWAHEHGFRAWEDNQMANRSVDEQKRIAAAMQRLGMRMGVFVANFGTAFKEHTFTSGKQDSLENFLNDLNNAVEVAKRVNAKWMTIVLGTKDHRLPTEFQHANAIDMLRRGAEIFEKHNLVMVMEPLNFRDHPDLYLERSAHAYMLCKAVQSPAVKILFDIYHQSITEGNLIPNIMRYWDEIAYFQIGDNPGRKEPYTGEVNYQNVFQRIHKRGFDGILGMEHGNSQGGEDGESKLLSAYRKADSFTN
ncbi:MAG: TIM barrel protein [Planctomycetes bacterium]|nr:TIM barrel protein [Planctomycetota bacterium]